jgi:serine-type D-Ala-D-Ala carboxypeptidase/endopeptidase
MRGISAHRRSLLLAALGLPIIGVPGYPQQKSPTRNNGDAALLHRAPSSDEIHALLAEHVDVGRDSVGYVALIRDANGPRFVTYGRAGGENSRKLDGDTIFEIGSITKVFTALLLMDMVVRGEVALSDPLVKYLPEEGRLKAFDGRPISLLDLVTYTSGLPRMPPNFHRRDEADPYADYTVQQLYSFLHDYTPQYYPGSHYEYSNLGFGLLGHVLSLRAGRSYEELVVSRICDPLGLNDTRITLTAVMSGRLAEGHNTSLQSVPNWNLSPAFAGAGALRSTANDLLRFLDACQGRRKSSLEPAIARLLQVRRQTGVKNVYAAAGWFVSTAHNDELVTKSGETAGYSTFIGYSTRTRMEAVLLANAASWWTTVALGVHFIDVNFPPPKLHRQVPIDPKILGAYVGRYALTPRFVLTVTTKDGHLMVQATGQDENEVFPASETRFFYRVVDAQITFKRAPDGTVPALVLHQNGRNRRALRLP